MHIEGDKGIAKRAEEYAPYFLKFGEDVVIEGGCFFSHPENIIIDDGTGINRLTSMYGSGGIRIGRKVRIGPCTFFHSANHLLPHEGEATRDWKGTFEYRQSEINDFCLISAHCIILPGVKLLPATKVAAGVVLTRGNYESDGWIVNDRSKRL